MPNRPTSKLRTFFLPFYHSFPEDKLTGIPSNNDSLLNQILGDAVARAELKSMLDVTLQGENIEFWTQVLVFEGLSNASTRVQKAKEIIIEYISDSAVDQINLKSHIKKRLMKYLNSGDQALAKSGLFREAKVEVLNDISKLPPTRKYIDLYVDAQLEMEMAESTAGGVTKTKSVSVFGGKNVV